MCRASGKLANLTIRSTAAACITHLQGHLIVDVRSSCHLMQCFWKAFFSAMQLCDLLRACVWLWHPLGRGLHVYILSSMGNISS